MTETPGPGTVAASILFLRWQQGDTLSLDALLVQRLNAALRGWDAAQRLVLQAPGGLVVAGPVPPTVAMAAARRIADDKELPALRAGLHVGDLRITEDRAVQARVAGVALHAAAAAAEGSGKDRVGVTPAFRAALAAQGDRRRRSLLAATGLVVLLGAGFAAREAREQYELRRPGAIMLDVRPWGDVFVDGEPKGRTPPLVRVSVPPGLHVIEVRNGRFKPVRMEMHVQPGEELQLKHVFTAPPPQRPARKEPGVLDRFKFW
jgi:hypothetical protein